MREILFRGKRLCNGMWVEGGFHSRFDRAFIIGISQSLRFDGVEVDPATIGQYIGLKDKNGKRIFEGDIVDILTENEEVGVIEWSDGGFIVSADGFCVDFLHNINGKDVEVIGNIHDNPGLMGGRYEP